MKNKANDNSLIPNPGIRRTCAGSLWLRCIRRFLSRSCGCWAAILWLSVPLNPAAQPQPTEEYLWAHPELSKPDSRDLAFTGNSYAQMKIDSIYFMTWFNEGWLLTINFFHMEAWFTDQWAVHMMVMQPGGQTTTYKYTLDGKKIEYDTNRIFVTDGTNTIQGQNRSYRVNLNFAEIACNLLFTGLLNPWSPGTGWDYMTPDKNIFYYRTLLCPWALVTGEIRINGQTRKLQGQGYADKYLSVNPPTQTTPFLYAMRLYSADKLPQAQRWHINLLDTASHEALGSIPMRYLVVARDEEWVFTTKDFNLSLQETTVHPKSKYEYPMQVRLQGAGNGYQLRGEYTCGMMIDYLDILEEIPSWFRFVVLLFFKRPVRFFFTGDFSGTITTPQGDAINLQLAGPLSYMVIR